MFLSSNNLTDEQQELAESIRTRESVRCDAVAGSGKTTAIVAGLRDCGAETLAIVFNKAVATRLADDDIKCEARTSHSFGFEALRKGGKRVTKIDKFKTRAICDEHFPDATAEDDLEGFVNFAKNFGYSPTEYTLCSFEDLQEAKPNRKISQGMLDMVLKISIRAPEIDFNDMLYLPIMLGFPMPRYDHVVIDESQDFSPLQIKMVEEIKPKSVVAVGDPLQAIYAWRGASQDSLGKFEEMYALKRKRLTCSFRCSLAVAERAQTWEPDFRPRPGAPQGLVELENYPNLQRRNAAILGRRRIDVIISAFNAIQRGHRIKLVGDLNIVKQMQKRFGVELNGLKAWEAENPTAFRVEITEILLGLKDHAELVGIPLTKLISEITSNHHPGATTFSTIHQAKGLEWDHVHILRHDWAEDSQEESNLKYVATTRAITSLGLGK